MAISLSTRQHGPSSVHSTPAHMTVTLLQYLAALPAPYDAIMHKGVWEPAAGSGAMVRVVRSMLPEAPLLATDAYPVPPHPDPARRLTVHTPVDFLKFEAPASAPVPHLILTNPPFSLQTKFIAAVTRTIIGRPYRIGALLMPLASLATQRRYPLHTNAPPTSLLIFSTRHAMYADGDPDRPEDYDSPTSLGQGLLDYLWMVWATDAAGRLVPPQSIAPAVSWVKPHPKRRRTGPKPKPKNTVPRSRKEPGSDP